MSFFRSLCLCVLLVAAGCGSGTRGAPDSSDIDAAPELSLVEELRIGSFDDPDLGFSRIGDVDVDRDGNIYAVDVQASEIRVFDPEGTLVRRIGRAGEGPGEFERGSGFAMGVTGDTVWTVDVGNERITLFDRQGEVVAAHRSESLRVPRPECSGYVTPDRLMPDGTFSSWLSIVRCRPVDDQNSVARGDSIPVPRIRFTAQGEILDTVGWDPLGPPAMMGHPEIPSGEYTPPLTVGENRYRIPSAPRPRSIRWIGLPDGRIVTDVRLATSAGPSTFTVTRIGLDQDTAYHRELTYIPIPFASADLDSLAAAAARSGPGIWMDGVAVTVSQDPADVARAFTRIRAEMSFPAFRPAISYAQLLSDDGWTWLRREGPGGAGRWVVIDPAGSVVGRVSLAPDALPQWTDGETVLVIEPDDLDVPWLVRYRIEG